ncbi:carbonic anhydrase family protein, partial [Richelia intracellularis]|uniref:carbonic anhydrase family protein n=1 Tax=Richelia intracellularis TaxID=1164990 RepID=UPI0022AC6B85
MHKSKRGFLAVVGVFLKQGNYNQLLESLWRMMPYQESKEVRFPYITINAQDLIPQSERVYMYYGSLTTPPCSENIYWIVFQEPLEISTDQI